MGGGGDSYSMNRTNMTVQEGRKRKNETCTCFADLGLRTERRLTTRALVGY